jgi:predicted ATP-grasp superfamily ATP-dependent carboligase
MTSRPPGARPGRRLRILFTEGSSLSARQALYALGPTGAVIDVCDPRPWFCLARYSRYVRACHRCPPLGADPRGYLDFLIERLGAGRYDVLLPTHDQVFLVSRFRAALPARVRVPVPNFAALERLQGKAEFLRLLTELGLPHPPTAPVRTSGELARACSYPCYVKLSVGTAGRGVWLVRSPAEGRQVADHLERAGLLAGGAEVLVQQPAPGVLGVAQAVFRRGRLVAGHCYEARALGVGGSARARISAAHPPVLGHVAALGAHLGWHGALTVDYLWDPASRRPAYIDANPRLGESLNATLSGVNLSAVLVAVALDRPVPPPASPQLGVKTHAISMALLALAEAGAPRRRLLAELACAWAGRGLYAGSQDELTRPGDDPPSLLPAAYLALRLLLNPRTADALVAGVVDNYALSAASVQAIRGAPWATEHPSTSRSAPAPSRPHPSGT